MLDTVFGLPIHPLIVHATVVMVPVATLLVGLCAAVPATRRRLAWPTVLACLVATVTVAGAALSGGPLEARVGGGALIHHHADLAKLLVAWVLVMSAAAVALAYTDWYREGTPVAGWLPVRPQMIRALAPAAMGRLVGTRWLLPALAVLSLVTALGTLVQIVLVGHSGAQAAWSGVGRAGGR
ncbi:DUF2231 domain-containing protein [Rugosimonospora africana]|uniref:Uncharacterized protein n=1 Tax=Rugosimonospora africana TaxID=556532 RepID=A0A8J3R7M6_9ACTN|nr:DUF2231 domain-containing protein [Rugosimonospora africana]GIH21516.1 hypothetical protein Raf01_96880 [Rugosimonospora africana]